MNFWQKIYKSSEFHETMQKGKKRIFSSFIGFFYIKKENIINEYNFINIDSQNIQNLSYTNNQFLHNKNIPKCVKIGIIASKKVGKSVIRNRCKRLIRSIYRDIFCKNGFIVIDKLNHEINYNNFSNTCYIVFIARKNMLNMKYSKLVEEFKYFFQKYYFIV
ncbi:ribonuclease P protein component [Lyticum sinuosum]|uniref:Ribonuclease P protein component n=1 Tax=Lyticum sinuosum TaxID=1332059 RepID=A0AAE5AHU7_9RICK|nr:ribonuclease P protein component [Lyticum sinuosum]MDZ5761194.1 Ribonuclease P protein component domain protein [Lyticum sinuosum]